MHKTIWIALSLILLASPSLGRAQQEKSAAEAARKAREQKKSATKAKVVYTNDNLPEVAGQISVVGVPQAPPKANGAKGAEPAAVEQKKEEQPEEKGEAYWRKRFAEARARVRQAEKELDILQRELNLMNVQYYSDPNKALREGYERADINEQRKRIDDKQKEVQQLRQALSDLESELRKAGAPAAWGRES